MTVKENCDYLSEVVVDFEPHDATVAIVIGKAPGAVLFHSRCGFDRDQLIELLRDALKILRTERTSCAGSRRLQ